MDGIYKHYIIDMSSNNNFVQIPTMQGDGNNVRGFELEFISNNVPYKIDTDNIIVSIAGTKSDTKHILNECTVTNEGYVLVDITSQMSAVKGRGDYCIIFMDKTKNSQLKSFPFYILTTSAPFNISEIISSDEFQLLTKRITQVEEVVIEGNEEIEALQKLNAEVTVNENGRVSAEKTRISNENKRIEAENARKTTETNRLNAESTREKNEEARKTNEINRQNAEATRVSNENTRISNENTRKSNETTRQNNEVERQANEDNRITSETNRQNTFDTLMDVANGEVERLKQENETASISAKNATESEKVAIQKANEASSSATASALSEKNAKTSEETSSAMADLAKSYAIGTNGIVRPNDATDSAKYFCELAERHALASGGILYMGTKPFSALSLEENQVTNYLFNISEKFVSDDTFEDGAGIKYPAGTNVCRTDKGTWDVFTGIESFGTGEIVTDSIYDEPTDQSEGEYWSFAY